MALPCSRLERFPCYWLMTTQFHQRKCVCGKLYSFNTEDEAIVFALSDFTVGLSLNGAHYCKDGEVWHATSHQSNSRYKLLMLEKELQRAMATIRESVIDYMEFWYAKKNQSKFTSAEVIEGVRRKHPTTAKSTISAAISGLKGGDNPLIMDLGIVERAPGTAGARTKYIGLVKHIDAETAPKIEPVKEEKVKPVAKSEVTKPEVKLPSQVAANPFDKVNSQLGELLRKVDGLSNGYAQVVEYQNMQRSALETLVANHPASEEIYDLLKIVQDEQRAVLTAIKDSEVSLDIADIKEIRKVVNEENSVLLKAVESTVINQNDKQYARILTRLDGNLEDIKDFVDKIQIPENVNSSDDYKSGIQAGIRIAIEMGLQLPGM